MALSGPAINGQEHGLNLRVLEILDDACRAAFEGERDAIERRVGHGHALPLEQFPNLGEPEALVQPRRRSGAGRTARSAARRR